MYVHGYDKFEYKGNKYQSLYHRLLVINEDEDNVKVYKGTPLDSKVETYRESNFIDRLLAEGKIKLLKTNKTRRGQ
jgi:hypothetical protein